MDAAVAEVYREDIQEKAKMNRSSFHKKNGSAVSKLGQKNMSWQEIQSKHGECKQYFINSLTMSYEEFQEMPNDLKIEYINKLQDTYDITIKHIGRELFKLPDDNTLKLYLQEIGILKFCNPEKRRGKTGLNRFKSDISEERKRVELADIIDIQAMQDHPDIIPMFMTWEEFKKLSGDDKVIFVNRLIRQYGVRLRTIDTILFLFNTPHLRSNLINAKVFEQIIPALPGSNGHVNPKELKHFRDDVDAWRSKTEMKNSNNDKELKGEQTMDIQKPENKTVFTKGTEPPHYADLSDLSNYELPKDPVPVREESVSTSERTFATNYISESGLNENEFQAIAILFRGKRVQVQMTIRSL